MNVLIIGGAGMLGAMTTPVLCQHHTVRVLDLMPSPVDDVESVIGDAADPDAVAAAMAGVEAVIHQAVVVPRSVKTMDPQQVAAAFAVNVASVHLAATTATRLGVRSFVHVSSLSVFQSYGVKRIMNDDRPDAAYPYGLTKRLGEEVCAAVLGGTTPLLSGACSLRLGHPTPDADWPRWRPPVGEVTDVMMADGTPLPALAGSDAATALDAALGYAGPYRTFPVTGDVSGAAIDQSVTAQVLDWQPRPAPPSVR